MTDLQRISPENRSRGFQSVYQPQRELNVPSIPRRSEVREAQLLHPRARASLDIFETSDGPQNFSADLPAFHGRRIQMPWALWCFSGWYNNLEFGYPHSSERRSPESTSYSKLLQHLAKAIEIGFDASQHAHIGPSTVRIGDDAFSRESGEN